MPALTRLGILTGGGDAPGLNAVIRAVVKCASNAGIECIGCGVCYAACDVVKWNRDYLGPAALNRAWTLVNDERDAQTRERLRAVAGDAGCHACHTLMSCTEHCPKALSPTRAISGLKRATWRIALEPGE